MKNELLSSTPMPSPTPSPPPEVLEMESLASEEPDSLLNKLIGAIQERRFPDAMSIINTLKSISTVQSALASQHQLETKLTKENAQLEISRDEVSRLTDENIKLKVLSILL